MSRIIAFEADNFKRLTAVSITPDGNIIELTGKNDQGKSSIIDAIWFAAQGKASGAAMPLKRGADKGGVKIDIGKKGAKPDLSIVRRVTAKGSHTLKVTNAEGFNANEPQTLLDKLFQHLAFDPEEFSRMNQDDQKEMLSKVAGLDTKDLDAEYAKLFAERTIANRDVKSAKAELDAIVLPPEPEAAGEEKDIAAIAAKLVEYEKTRAKNREERKRVSELQIAASQATSSMFAWQKAKEKLEAELAKANEELEKAKERADQAHETAGKAKEAADQLQDPDTADIDRQIAEAKAHNQTVQQQRRKADDYQRRKDQHEQAQTKHTTKKNQADRLTERLEQIEAEKQARIAAAKFPYPGMSIDDKLGVMIDGVPLDDASSSQKLLVGLKVAAALNAEVRIICIRHGSLCDPERLKLIDEWAGENDYQVWLERTTGGEQVGVVIEDGMIRTEPKPASEGSDEKKK